MEKKQKGARVASIALALAGLLLVWTLATAGDLEPNAPPASTMKTLDEIYDAVIEGASGIAEREGYIKCIEVDPNSTYNFFTVPAGNCFVLMKISTEYTVIKLTVNDQPFIGSRSFYRFDTRCNFADFPDRCVVVNAGETLKAVNDQTFAVEISIVGYFYDVP